MVLWMAYLILVICIPLAEKNIFFERYNDDNHDEFYTPNGSTPRDIPDLESEESAEQRRN